MVAGIFEKSKRLRKVLFFIVKKLPISRAARAASNLRNVWRLSRRGSYSFVELVNAESKRRWGACGDRCSRRRHARRFVLLDLNSFAPVFLRPVSVPPACGTAPKTCLEAHARLPVRSAGSRPDCAARGSDVI